MAYGLKTFDGNGNVVFDPTIPLGRVLGTVTVSDNGSLNVPAFAQGTPFFMCLTPNGNAYNPPDVSAAGTTLSWVYSSSGTGRFAKATVSIIYGVF